MPQPFYRNIISSDLINFRVSFKMSDILISANKDLKEVAFKYLKKLYSQIEEFGRRYSHWLRSLQPVELNIKVSPIIELMNTSAENAGVGPMAAVAGAIAEILGRYLNNFSDEIIIENGGDIYLNIKKERICTIYAGESPLSNKIGIKIKANSSLGIATSSGTVGHSLSLGQADAVTVIASSSVLADAWATRLANVVKNASYIPEALRLAKSKPSILGVVIIKGNQLGSWGKIELCKI